MAYTDDAIELFEQQEAERLRLQQEQQQQAEQPKEQRVEAEQQEVRSRSGRGAGRSAFSTKAQREQREAQAQAMREQEEQMREAEGDPIEVDKEDGFITRAGERIQNAFDFPQNAMGQATDALDSITPEDSPFKPVTSFLADRVMGADEWQQRMAESSELGATIVGGQLGTEAGLLSPLTIAGRARNEQTPWNERPEIIQDSDLADSVFTIMSVVTPSLVVGVATGGLGAGPTAGAVGTTTLVTESALETAATTENLDDALAGRQAARAVGAIATRLGYDGDELTRELIRGESKRSQAFIAVYGFLSNMGINIGANQLLSVASAGRRVPTTGETKAADALGQTTDEVVDAVDDVKPTAYTPDAEPTESIRIDDGVSKPSAGNESISTQAMATELLDDDVAPRLRGDRRQRYFSNVDAVSTSKDVQRVVREATRSLDRLLPASANREFISMRVGQWWEANRGLLDTDLNDFTRRYAMDMVRPLDDMLTGKPTKVSLFPNGAADTAPFDAVERVLRDEAMADADGLVSGVVILEELGQRAKDIAKQAVGLNIQTKPIDYTATIERLLDMNDKVQLFAAPVRKGKRYSSDLMAVQQRGFLDSIFNRDESDAFAADVFGIRMTDDDVAKAPRDFWEAAKNGDKEAQKTIDTWVNILAGADPATASSDLLTMSYVLREAAKKGRADAWRNLRYASMLSGTKTHSLALQGNMVNIIGNPLGAYLSGDIRYANGQMHGLMASIGDSLQRFGHSWRNYSSLQSTSRVENVAVDLARNQQAMDDSFEMVMRQLNAEGADPFKRASVWLAHNMASLGNQPWVSTFHRSLTAIDALADTIIGSQISHGRAAMDAAQPGALPYKDLVEYHMDHVFRDGIMEGTVPKDIQAVVKWNTYSRDIPNSKWNQGNAVDQTFDIVNRASKDNPFANFITPFTRMGWNYLDRFVATDPTLGRAFRQVVPRYKNILAGKEGEAMKMQLRHGIALGNALAFVGTASGFMGFSTGFTDEKNKGSLIIPADNAQGYRAIPIWQMGHLGAIFSVYSDLGSLLRNKVLTTGQYEEAIGLMAFSFAMSTLDQSFTASINNSLGMLNPRNFGYGTLRQMAGMVGLNVMPSLARQVIGYSQPYEVNARVQDQPVTTAINYIRQSMFGGAGMDTRYDELSGDAIPRSNVVGDGQNYWASVASMIFSDSVYPGDIKPAGDKGGFSLPGKREDFKNWSPPEDAKQLRALLNTLGYSHDRSSSLRTYGGTPLSTAQQSTVQQMMGETGALRNRLVVYFDSDEFRGNWSRFLMARESGQDYKQHLEAIHNGIRRTYRDAKSYTVPEALKDDLDYQRARMATRGQPVDLQKKASPVDTLYAVGNGQAGIMSLELDKL